jgi:hypothetical protein
MYEIPRERNIHQRKEAEFIPTMDPHSLDIIIKGESIGMLQNHPERASRAVFSIPNNFNSVNIPLSILATVVEKGKTLKNSNHNRGFESLEFRMSMDRNSLDIIANDYYIGMLQNHSERSPQVVFNGEHLVAYPIALLEKIVERSHNYPHGADLRISPEQQKILQREKQRPVTEEDLRRQSDAIKIKADKKGPLRLIGSALESHSIKVYSWGDGDFVPGLISIHAGLYELTPEEIGEREKGRVLALLQESGVKESLAEDEALVMQRSEPETDTKNPELFWVNDIALERDGIFRYLKMGMKSTGPDTQVLTRIPIPVEDYPKYSELVDEVVKKYFEAHKTQ